MFGNLGQSMSLVRQMLSTSVNMSALKMKVASASHKKCANAVWAKEEIDIYARGLDQLRPKAEVKQNLNNLLWVLKPWLLRALRRGSTVKEIHEIFCQSPRFKHSYRSLARALRLFRTANDLPQAYAERKSRPAGEQQEPTTGSPAYEPTCQPLPRASNVPKSLAPQSSPSSAVSGGHDLPKPVHAGRTSIPKNVNDFIERLRPVLPESGLVEKTEDEMRIEDLRFREARVRAMYPDP